MSKRSRILSGIGIAVVVTGAYLYLFGVQTAFGLMERYKFRKLPEAWETPMPLSDSSISPTVHRQSSFCGYQFELPWDDVYEQKILSAGSVQLTTFRSRNTFWFSCSPPRSFVDGVIKEMKLDPETFRRAYGDAAFDSDYAFYRAMLSVTPDSITLLTPRQQVARDSMLLLLKIMAMPPTDSGISLVKTPQFKGFQFGSPQARPIGISDELYADDGEIDVVFFQNKHSSAPAVSQAEINRVIQSVRKIGIQKMLR